MSKVAAGRGQGDDGRDGWQGEEDVRHQFGRKEFDMHRGGLQEIGHDRMDDPSRDRFVVSTVAREDVL